MWKPLYFKIQTINRLVWETSAILPQPKITANLTSQRYIQKQTGISAFILSMSDTLLAITLSSVSNEKHMCNVTP
jgi:energy-converting hydrogenase Eha subunit A